MSKNLLKLFARTLHGIEWISAAEIEGRCNATISNIGHREIRFSINQLEKSLFDLGSIDDVFLQCKLVKDLDHTRASLSALHEHSARIDFSNIISTLSSVRKIPKQPVFDVVASFLGRRNYNRFEIEDTVGDAIRKCMKWKYIPQKEKESSPIDLSFRVHLSGREAIFGVRLSDTPLHRRAYKQTSRTGTLHPPLAFAMGLIAGLKTNDYVLDPFCGVGTIPIEVLRVKPDIGRSIGIDIDAESVHKAAENAQIAQLAPLFFCGDAGRLPFNNETIDKVISNPPWGQVVEARGSLKNDFKLFFKEIMRVAHENSRFVFLINSNQKEFLDYSKDKLNFLFGVPISLFGSWADMCFYANNPSERVINNDGLFGENLYKYWLLRSTIKSKTDANHVSK